MIISASRRTDIPAFYSKWFMNRVKAGFIRVPNPLNAKQIADVAINCDEVEAIVFWSKNPAPLIPCLPELDERGFRYYFQFTLNDYPAALEPNVPSVDSRISTFRALADLLGPRRVIWRYDPIIVSNYTPVEYHKERFAYIADQLKGKTSRVMISFVDLYQKTERRLVKLEKEEGYQFQRQSSFDENSSLARYLATIAKENAMEIFTCAEERDYSQSGIRSGMCIDNRLIADLWSLTVNDRKDPSQRECCLCRQSKDIGMNNSCLQGCVYCYATTSLEIATRHFSQHDPNSPSLFGSLDAKQTASKHDGSFNQQKRLL